MAVLVGGVILAIAGIVISISILNLSKEAGFMRGRRGGYYGGGGGLIGLLAIMLIAIYAMPFVGGYVLITGKDNGSKLLGGSLLVVGIIIWIAMGIH